MSSCGRRITGQLVVGDGTSVVEWSERMTSTTTTTKKSRVSR